jgi:hypothetical protein
MRVLRTCIAAICTIALATCADPLPPPKVDFLIDAPLCSMSLPLAFTIDGAQVGVDTFEVHYGPGNDRSRNFETTAGSHQLAVRFFPSGNLIQQDSSVTLLAGDTYTFRFGFYCS